MSRAAPRGSRRWPTIAVSVLVATLARATPGDASPAAAFVSRPFALSDSHIVFDLGVGSDVDGDGVPDIFSTDHNALQTLRLGDGAMGLPHGEDVLDALGLEQARPFPASRRRARLPRSRHRASICGGRAPTRSSCTDEIGRVSRR